MRPTPPQIPNAIPSPGLIVCQVILFFGSVGLLAWNGCSRQPSILPRHIPTALTQRSIPSWTVTENSARFPVGTVLVAHPQKGNTVLWATTQTLYNSHTGAQFAFPKSGFLCKRIVWSPDQKRLLVIGSEAGYEEDSFVTQAYVLEAASLRLVRHLKTPVVWWQGSDYAYLEADREPQRIASSAGKTYRVPSNLEICSADPYDGYLLGATFPKGEAGWTARFHLWKLTSRGKLQYYRVVGKSIFDPGSSGVPQACGRVGKRVVVGVPHGGAFETLEIAEGQRMTALSLGTSQADLMSVRGPYPAENGLFGLVRPVTFGDQPRQEAYLYQITDQAVTLTKMDSKVVFVYYDPIRRAIGVGSAGADGVVVRYLPINISTRQPKIEASVGVHIRGNP